MTGFNPPERGLIVNAERTPRSVPSSVADEFLYGKPSQAGGEMTKTKTAEEELADFLALDKCPDCKRALRHSFVPLSQLEGKPPVCLMKVCDPCGVYHTYQTPLAPFNEFSSLVTVR